MVIILFSSCKGKLSDREKIKKEADYILSCQYVNDYKNSAYGAINNVQGKPTWVVPRENSLAILGLMIASEYLNERVYREMAELAADYLVKVQDSDGGWYNQYSYTSPGDPKDSGNAGTLGKSPTQAQVLYAFEKLVVICQMK